MSNIVEAVRILREQAIIDVEAVNFLQLVVNTNVKNKSLKYMAAYTFCDTESIANNIKFFKKYGIIEAKCNNKQLYTIKILPNILENVKSMLQKFKEEDKFDQVEEDGDFSVYDHVLLDSTPFLHYFYQKMEEKVLSHCDILLLMVLYKMDVDTYLRYGYNVLAYRLGVTEGRVKRSMCNLRKLKLIDTKVENDVRYIRFNIKTIVNDYQNKEQD